MRKHSVKSVALHLRFFLASFIFIIGAGWAVSDSARWLAARDGEPPPFPIVYHGMVMVDGYPGSDNMQLVARAGEYETHPVRVKNGKFLNLVVQPPDGSYFEMVITFHTETLQARESGVFLEMANPDVQILNLNFDTATGVDDATDTATGVDDATDTATGVDDATDTATGVDDATSIESGVRWMAIAAVVIGLAGVIGGCVWWWNRGRGDRPNAHGDGGNG